MEALIAGLVVVMVLVFVAGGIGAARRWVWRPLIAGRVIVQLDNDMAVSGLLVERRGSLLMLADAQIHTAKQQPVKADGRAIIERSRVLWIQAV
jgi:aspartyl aminopeptidase